jgi:hypothetical protein
MDKEIHLQYLRGKYIELSRKYLNELHQGKSKEQLKDLADVIKQLIEEMERLEQQ